MIYAVIDTNVIVSALITKHHDAATCKVLLHVVRGDVTPLYNEEIMEEYLEVLSRKKFHLSPTEIRGIIDYFLENGIYMNRTSFDKTMLDEDDRVFYEVSLSKEESFLVTGNLKHYPVSPKVVSPNDFIRLMDF